MSEWYQGSRRTPLLEGERIRLGGQEFTIPPFKLREWVALAPVRAKLREAAADSPDDLIGRIAFVHVALTRNYPEMTLTDMLENCDPPDLLPALEAVIRVNEGLFGRYPGEAGAPALNGATTNEKNGSC